MTQSTEPQPGRGDRFKIAIRVLKWASIGIFSLAIAVIIAAAILSDSKSDPEILADTTKYVFTAILPLLGTWVGTIIAFYFSSDNFETASASTRKAVREAKNGGLETFIAGETMRPYDQIEKVELDDSDKNKMLDVNLEEKFTRKLSRAITRIPVFTKSRIAQYIIHESVLYHFSLEFQKEAFLKDLLDYEGGKYEKIISSTFAVVSKNATLAFAKSAMERVRQETGEPCQDVFVTETGDKGEPVLGWLSDKRIERYSHLEG